MADETNGGNGNGAATDERQFLLKLLYVKDLSFEAPNAPEIFDGQAGEPDVQMNLRSNHRDLGDGTFEGLLHLSVHASAGGRSVFLAELDQAGVFGIKGYNDEERRRLLGIFCPNTLFPYARESISSIVSKGGFPPLLLQPINFETLYAQGQAQQQPAQT